MAQPLGTSGVLASLLGAEVVGSPDVVITSVDGVEHAGPNSLTFIRSPKYAAAWAASTAGVALITKGIAVPEFDRGKRALVVVPDADRAMIALLERFAPKPPEPVPGIHPTAIVNPSATIAPTATVGPLCTVEAGAVVRDRTVLTAQVFIGRGARIGTACTLHPGVRVLHACTVGDRCIFWPGVCIGADGFGYIQDPPPPRGSGRGNIKVPHLGHVEIGSDVEIGANSCVDRGKFGPTVVGDGSKLDNLVQVGHNCRLGKHVVLCGAVAVAGSVTMGDGVLVGGQTAIRESVTIGAGAIITAGASVITDVPAGEAWTGTPAMPHREAMRNVSAYTKLAETTREVRKLIAASQKAAGG